MLFWEIGNKFHEQLNRNSYIQRSWECNKFNKFFTGSKDILIVDDSSPDKTSDLVRGHIKFQKSVYLIERTENVDMLPRVKLDLNMGFKKLSIINSNGCRLLPLNWRFEDMLSFSTDYDLIIKVGTLLAAKLQDGE